MIPNVRAASPLSTDLNHTARRSCFVISPKCEKNKDKSERTQWVWDNYVVPASQKVGVNASESHQFIEDLLSDEVVIAYLGSPPWEHNVMIEVAYRLATERPIVFLREPGEEKSFPFDLRDHPVIFLPDEESNAPDKLKKRNDVIEKLSALIEKCSTKDSSWMSTYAVASIVIFLNEEKHKEPVFVEASPEAERLFQMSQNSLKGYSVKLFLSDLMQQMPKYQQEPFFEEQKRLIAELAALPLDPIGALFKDLTHEVPANCVAAKVPIVFMKHKEPKLSRQAFLPIIIQHHMSHTRTRLHLKVLYLNVSASVRRDDTGIYYVCDLFTERFIDPDPPSDDEQMLPVFCVCATNNEAEVTKITSQFEANHLSPIMAQLDDDDFWETKLRAEVRKAKGVAVFIGRERSSKWGEHELRVLNSVCVEMNLPLFPVLVSGAKSIPAVLESALTSVSIDDEASDFPGSLSERLRRQRPR